MSRYVTVAEFRDWLGVGDTVMDVEIQRALDAAEDVVEAFCGRRFTKDALPTTRLYRPSVSTQALRIEDTVSVSSVRTDDDDDGVHETTVTDHYLAPQDGDGARPYGWLVRRNGVWREGVSVEVTGIHGWPSVPAAVREATVHQAYAFLRRMPTIVVGIEEDGSAPPPARESRYPEPRVSLLLAPYRRVVA